MVMSRKISLSPYIAERIQRKRKDFRVDHFSSGGPGGANQNCTNSGTRITDLITGLSAEGRNQRDQPQNTSAAFNRLVEKLIDFYRKEELAQHTKDPNAQKAIRTYNFKRNEVKDTRTGATYPLDKVLNGELDRMLEEILVLKAKLDA
jgi:protein subunit release factor A